MTEVDWLAARDPEPMLEFLSRQGSVRKRRLFAVACCQRVLPLLPSERSRRWVDKAEQLADGRPGAGDLELEQNDDWEAFQHIDGFRRERMNNYWWHACLAAQGAIQDAREFRHSPRLPAGSTLSESHYHAAVAMAHAHRPNDAVELDPTKVVEELALQVPLVRDIFGNPFHHVAFDPAWLTWDMGTVPGIAQGIYEDRAFDRLPILADALEDAGCEDRAVLEHCRSEGPHVRGCWVLDMALGRK